MNEDKIQELAHRIVADMGGAFTVSLAYIGDQLGIFKAMDNAGPISSEELADKTGLNERYVREWLRAMVASQYIDYDTESERYVMTPEQGMVLAVEDSPAFCGGGFHFTIPSIYNVPRISDAFRQGGGVPYHEMGSSVHCALERFFRPGYLHSLINDWLPAIDGLVPRLEAGANVADVGCGRGQSTINMARAFPKTSFLGIDYHSESIAAALKLARDAGLENTEFLQASAEDIPSDGAYDLICTFDCIHDMIDPVATLKAVRTALGDDGIYLWSEPNASHAAHENQNPIGRLFHSVSPLHCMTVSLAYKGAGLGTVIGEKGARELAEEAGFSSFERLEIDNPFNQFFALKK